MKSVIQIAAVILLVAATVCCIVWMFVFPTPRFPQPTGPFSIGTQTFAWTDASRPEPFTTDPDDRRQLAVQVWYPAREAGQPESYLASAEPLRVLAKRFRIPAFLLGNIARAPTHTFKDAVAAEGRFPVLVHPGGFSGFRNASQFWIEDLVSHGYVVIGLDEPGTSAATILSDGRIIDAADKSDYDQYMPLALFRAPELVPRLNGVSLPGGIVPYLADDLRFVLDQLDQLDRQDPVLAGHLDMVRAGVFGMSLGGYVAPEACARDQRFRACLAVDAGKTASVAAEGLTQPLMIISRDAEVMRDERRQAGGWPDAEIRHTTGAQRALFQNNRADAYFVTMNGMYHVNWTDAPIWSPLVRWLGLAGPIDPYEGFRQTNAYTLAFFDRHLKGKASPLLESPGSKGPHVRLETRQVGAVR